MWEAPQQLQL